MSTPQQTEKNEHYTYLDAMRETGAINMLAAAPYLADEFNLSKREAREIHAAWMQDFGKDDAGAA
jgi:hypothetical protein